MAELWIAPEAEAVLQALRRVGIDAWIVGGCVRDMLRGETPHDWDVTAAAEPGEIEAALSGFRLIETGIRHGTVTAVSGGLPIEVTACRGEGAYTDMRHPSEVTFHRSIEEDLARRDFTVNALAYSKETGLLDLWHGLEDLKNGVIRCIGSPAARFSEDALRILRALRFSAVLGYEIEPGTATAIHALKENIRAVSAERCGAEFTKLLQGGRAAEVLLAYGDVIAVLLPQLGEKAGEDREAAWRQKTAALRFAPPDLPVRLALLLYDCDARSALRALRLSGAVTGRALLLIENFDALPAPTDAAVLRAMNRLGAEALTELSCLRAAYHAARGEETVGDVAVGAKIKELTARGACWQLSQLAISGDELIKLGYAGPELGRTLRRLLEAVMDGECENTPSALTALLTDPGKTP